MSRLRRGITVLAAAATLVALLAAPVYAAEGGTIQGKLVNGTANGSSVSGVEVTLTAYFGQTERNKNTTKTDQEGNFQFTGLDTSASYAYEAASTYQKGDYSAPRVSFSGPGETKQVTVKVYDGSSQEDLVKTTAKHYLLNTGNGQVEVTEILVLNNPSDKTFIGSREVGPDQRETSRYLPPSDAKNVEYGDGLMSCCVVKDGAGFVDTMAINPGESQKIFTYKMPYSGTSIAFSTTLQQTVDKVQVLVPNTGIQANVSGLASHGTQTLQGASYLVFSGEKLPANTTLNVDLQGLPASQLAGGPILMVGVTVAVLAALALAFYLLRRRSEPATAPIPSYYLPSSTSQKRGSQRGPARNPALLELERRELLAGLANLDDLYESGRLHRKDYERLRAEKKARLVQLTRQLGAKGAPARA